MRCKVKNKAAVVTLTFVALTVCACAVVLVNPLGMMASSHREAPITALDPMADITDLWAFRSYDAQGHDTSTPSITIIMGVNPFEEPANGPNWFPFDPQIMYELHVDNNGDGLGDIVFQISFRRPNTNCRPSTPGWRASPRIPAIRLRVSRPRLLISPIPV